MLVQSGHPTSVLTCYHVWIFYWPEMMWWRGSPWHPLEILILRIPYQSTQTFYGDPTWDIQRLCWHVIMSDFSIGQKWCRPVVHLDRHSRYSFFESSISLYSLSMVVQNGWMISLRFINQYRLFLRSMFESVRRLFVTKLLKRKKVQWGCRLPFFHDGQNNMSESLIMKQNNLRRWHISSARSFEQYPSKYSKRRKT